MAKKNKGYKTKAELEKSYIRTKEEAERITAGREKLSDLFKNAAKQGVQLSRERQEKENSIKRTDAWKNISVSDQNRTGNNYSTYAAKMIRDTPGALQREEEREAKRREEIRKQNQPIVDRVMRWNQPGAEKIARQAHNDIVLGGQKPKQTVTEKQLTDSAASIARRVAQENPIGTKKQVDLSTIGSQARTQGVGKKTGTGAGIGINYIAGRNAAGADRTKEKTQAGTVSAVRKIAKAGGNNLTVSDSKTLAGRTAGTGGNRNTLNTFLNGFSTDKAQGSRGPMARDEDILTRHFTNVVKKAQEAAKAGSGYDSVKLYRNQNSVKGKPTEDIFGRIGVREYNGYSTWMQKMAESGVFDNGTDPTMMTDEGLRNNIAKWDAQQRGIKRTANTLLNEKTNMQPGQIFGKVADPERRNDTIELADNYFRYEYSPEMFEGDSRESIREMVYNRIMEDRDTYEERTARMTEREKAAFDQQIDAAIEAANNPTKENTPEIYQSQYGSMISEAKAYGSYISNAMAEQKRREKQAWYDNLVATKFVTENGTYNEALIPAPKIRKEDFFSDKIVAEPQGTDIEKAYYWANHPGGSGIGTTRKEWFMLPEHLDMFNRMFAHDKEKGSNLAEMYLKALDGYLSSAKVKYEEAFARETADIPVLGTVAHGMTFPVNVGAGLGEVFTAIAALAGNEEARDKSSNLHSATRWVGNIRDERGEKVDDWVVSMLGENARGYAKQAMGILDSIGDNLFAMGAGTALAGGNRNAAMKLVQTIMSGEATAQSFVQDLDAGVDPTTAAIKALGQGAIEAITEKYSLETLLDPNLKELLGKPGQRAAYFAKSFLAEGSEEGASNLLGNAADVIVSGILGNETEARRRYNELVVEQGLSDKQAERQILAEQAQQLGAEMLAGGISGGIFAGGQIISNRNLQSKAGQQARTNTKGGGIDALIYTGLESDKGSMAYQQATELKAKQEQGKTVSNQEVGRLAQTLETEAKETLQASMQGEPVTENQVERSLRTLKSISDVMNNDVRQEQNGGLYLAGTQDIRNAEGQVTKGAREVLIDGKVAQIEGVRNFKDKDGKWNLKLKVNGQEVDPDSILNTNYHAAQILRQAAINPEMYSGQFVETLLEAEEKGLIRQEIGKALKDAKTVRTLSYMGLSADEISNITRINVKDDKMLSNVWQQGALEHGENRQNQVKGANRKTEGIVKHDGSLYKSDEWNNWFSKLDDNQKAQVDTIAGIAQRAGIEVDFRDMDSETYGLEGNLGDGRTGIAVNLGGIDYGMIEGNKTEKGRHNMLVTFGHEMTHWLQRNSMQGYNRLERFVANEYIRENGVDKLMSRLNKHMTGADNLSLEDALSEVVADSCDQILSDENVMRHIQDTDSKLYTEVKGFVRNLVDRFKTAMRNMSESASRDGSSMAGRINQISKVWLGAYDEAISGMIQQGEEAENDQVRNSRSDYSYNNLLRKPDMSVYRAAEISNQQLASDNAIPHNQFAKNMYQLFLNNNNGNDIVLNEDTKKEVKVNRDSFKHSIGRKVSKEYDIVCRNIVPMLKTAIAVNELKGREDSNYSTILFGAIDTKDSVIAARFNVQNRTGDVSDFDILYSIAKANIKKEGPVNTTPGLTNNTLSGSPSFDLSIADLLDIVKNSTSFKTVVSKDVARKLDIKRPYDPKISDALKYSKAQLDDDYEQARTSGDNARMRMIVDESARRNGYIPVTRFHQTGEKFTEFKTDNPVAGANDSETPNGIFFKENDHDIGVGGDYVKTGRGGDIQMPVYLKYDNMLHFKDRKEAVAWYKENVPGYREARENWDRIVKEKYDPQFAALEKEMFDPDTTEERYEELEEQEEKLIQELGKEENQNHRAMKELLNQYFLNGKSQYDGIELDYDGHRYIDGKREDVHTYIVFDPGQVKSADLVTYDDDGNVIKPSERFNDQKTDIRWSKAQNDERAIELRGAYQTAIDSVRELEQQIQDMKPELNAWTKRMMKAREDGTWDELLPEYKEWEKGYTKLNDELQKARERQQEANRAFDDYIEERDVKEEQEAIEKSGLTEEDWRRKQAVNMFGYTTDFREAGYMLPNGKMLNFCGSKGQHYGVRGNDHRTIGGIYASSKYQGSAAMTKFMDEGNIRVMAETPGIDIIKEPTADQYATIRQMARRFAGEEYFSVDFTDENGNNIDSIEYEGRVNPDKIVNDIKSFYKTGVAPTQSVVSQFHDTRWSKAQLTEEQQAEVDAAEENGIDLDVVNHTASRFSRASYERSEYYKDPKKMARMLAKNVLGSESKANIAKAKKWIEDVTSISAMIADRSDVLDYVASPGRSSFKSNPEYGGSIDSSTICAKRLLQTGTIDAIQRALPDYAMSAEDFLQVRRMMKERGYEVSCGLCFVESSRKNIAKYAQQFMNEWNSQHPDDKVTMPQINTVLGLEDTRLNRKEVYEAYEKFMNKLAQRKPKLFEMRSEYDNDILKHFKKDESVAQKNKNGGMRINSFSDFEIVHLIDMMQVIMDMGNVGLAGQAYTKVREFAEALGPTGLKINMSMIAKGVDENGKIIFDEVEGMKWADVEDLREKYADNVGTVCVVFTEDQLMAAMADDRIDFIIPFHRSQWKKSNYKDIGLPENTKDFTYWQNERYAKPVYGTKKDGSQKKLRATNYMPNEYWDPNKSGKENAEAYLKMCYENNKIPKFWKWLQSNGDGSYSLKADGSTDGYWKLLGDFKMYNHQTGEYAPQMPVQPNFDMDACERMLREYKGGHNEFPEAKDVVRDFVEEKKKGRKGISTKGGKIQLAGNEIDEGTRMSSWTEEGMDVNAWMNGLTPGSLQTADEGVLLQAYKDLRMKISLSLKRQLDYKAKIAQLEGKENLTAEQREDLRATKNRLEIEVNKLARLEDEMYKVTSSEGYAGMMYRENMKLKDYIEGKTQDQVRQTVEEMVRQVQKAQEQIAKDREEIRKLAETQAIKTVKSYMSKSSLGTWATRLRKAYNSSMNKGEVEDRLAEMALKDANGQDIQGDIETLAQDLLDKMRGQRTDELDFLRGQTLYIGKSLAAELRAENSSIKELQSRIRGSGVTLKTGDNSRLEEQWAELRGQKGALVDVDGLNPIDQLHGIVDFIASQVEASRGINQNKVDFDEVALMVKAAVKNIHTFITDDPAARAQIENLMKQIQEIGQKTGDVGNRLEELSRQMDEVVLAGQKAKGWTTILQRDVADAIRYYNKTAAVAAQEEKTKVRKALIEQLRSENTRKLMEQRDKYEERMKKDRKARELAEDNKKLRSRITTNMKWIKTRLTAETDQKNIPEEAKKLARFLSRMLVEHDLTEEFRSVMNATREDLQDFRERLVRMDAADGEFDMDTDLGFLVITAPNQDDNDYTLHDKVVKDLMDIESGLLEYRTAEGQGNVSLADRKAALDKIQDAVAEIRSVIQRRGEAFIRGKKYEVATLAEQMENEMGRSRFKGERKGFGRKARNAAVGAIGYGNLTPEYFFKNLRNGVMSLLHSGFQDAENRSGLEAAKAQAKIAKIAEETGFKNWDGQEKHKIRTKDGEIEITTEQLMALYATWKRESNQLRPEETAHLLHGGFVLAENKDDSKGKPRREKSNERPIRLNEDQAKALGGYLTDEQRAYVDAIVDYMSGELAELGNEASMDAYGIKKFTEQFYFPIKSWGGVLNKKSDAGITSKNDNRAMRQSFTKRIKANAQNAIEIGDFTPTAMKHIVGMITFNTVGPAVENMNKVLNQQLTHGEVQGTLEEPEDNRYKMNLRASFKKEYGAQALEYLEKFMADVNGGVTSQRTAFDSLLSIFKKNAVAGSLSVAAQQPLSYIRAAMMINPKYMAQALSPAYWKGSYKEMLEHSGVAVIKKMGKFDMNFGRSMQDYITPEGMVSKGRKLYETISEKSTSLPEMMDAATWTRMWTACKLEQKALNPEMDPSSDEFLDKVGERFNEVMRRTQVYDSVMTKSQNMRSKHFYAKTLTSFMAEPTLSLNVLADAVQNAKEEGGKKNVMKALATFALSAAAQAGAKALFGAGRSPDKKKTKEENFWNRFGINLLSEANPMSLIPGYSQLMDLLMNGELNDDTMGVIGKAVETLDNIWNLAVTGETKKGLYRDLEDSVGQLIQYMTKIPAKNIMRDFRAMVNWFSGGTAGFTGDTYAQRPTSSNVLKYQLIDTLASKELMGLLNEKLGEAGYGTKNDDYYRRIYSAEVSGDQETADGMKEYLLQGKGVAETAMNTALRALFKDDGNLNSAQKLEKQKEYGLKDTSGYVLEEYRAGNLTRTEAEKLYRAERPKAKDKDVLEAFDKIDWEKENGKDPEGYSNYTPLYEAIENNKADEIKAAVKYMTDNGYEPKDIKTQLTKKYKPEYLAAGTLPEKNRIRNAITIAYKAAGFTAEDANKVIDGWTKEKKKN